MSARCTGDGSLVSLPGHVSVTLCMEVPARPKHRPPLPLAALIGSRRSQSESWQAGRVQSKHARSLCSSQAGRGAGRQASL